MLKFCGLAILKYMLHKCNVNVENKLIKRNK